MVCSRMSIQLSVYLITHVHFVIGSFSSDSTLDASPCLINLNKPEGNIESPGYPYPTPPNTNCTWKFQLANSTSEQQWVYINFEEFVLHEHEDNLQFTGNHENISFSGSKAAFIVLVFPTSTITFQTGNSTFQRFFTATYSIKECVVNIRGNHDLLSSPFYPANITTPIQPASCKWILTAPPRSKIALSFIEFNLGKKASIDLYNAPDVEPHAVAHLTGNNLPPDEIGTEAHMTIVFNLDVTEQDVRFESEFNAALEECALAENVTEKYSISLPEINLPNAELFCVWILKTNASGGNASFLINFPKLDLKNLVDSLIISDGPSRYSPNIEVYAQNMPAVPDMITTGNSIYVSFASRQSYIKSNFSLDLEVQVNGGNYNDNGSFSLNPDKLKGNESVIFNLEVADHNQVEVTVSAKMSQDSEIIFYGIMPNKQRLSLNKFTANDTLYPIFSISNKMIIEAKGFNSNDSLMGQFHGIPKGCDQFDHSGIGAYQLNDSVDTNCTWLIRPSELSKDEIISLTFNTLNLGDKGMIKVYHGLAGKESNFVQSFNSSISYFPTIIISPDVGVRVDTYLRKAKTINDVTTRMSAFYEVMPGCAVASNLISGNVTELKSPGYPTRYPLNANCKWSLNIPRDLTFLLHFEDVDLHPSDTISVYTVQNGSSKLYYNVSEKGIPSDVLISENVTVEWKSSVSITSTQSVRGFSLKTEVLDCGENITQSSGDLDLPGEKILKLNRTVRCVWIINVGDKQPKSDDVYIVDFNYQATSGNNHTSSSLKILDGGSLNDNILSINNNVSSTLSRTNKIFIQYEANKSTVPMPSFKLTFSRKVCDKNHQCKNGICMHDDWKCNGENDCGDYSDEDNCNDTVLQSGVSATIVVVLALLAFLSGIGLTLVAPVAIRKVRAFRQRYNDFHTLPDD